jgi:hypothetical protein
MNTGTCRGCGQPVLWVEMAVSGKRNPLDPEPHPSGTIAIDTAGKAHYLKRGQEIFIDPNERYVSHFSTCPRAKEFRKP